MLAGTVANQLHELYIRLERSFFIESKNFSAHI